MGVKTRTGGTAVWLVPSLAAVIAVLVAFWLPKIFSEKPDLRFSLSSPISTKMLGAPSTAYIQEVAVSNVGDTAAKDVVFACDNGVLEYELHKSAETDRVQEYLSNGRFELRYQDLPPRGIFKIVLKSNSPASDFNINLKHSQGVGKNIFAKTSPITNMLSGSLIFVLYMIGWGWFTSKDTHTESDAQFHPKRILARKKPWHVRTRKWNQYTSTAIDSYFSKSFFHYNLGNLQENVGYKYLTVDKDVFDLEGETRERADKAAVTNFKEAVLYAMRNATGRDEAVKILDFVSSLKDAEYSTIRLETSKAWVSKMLELLSWAGRLTLADFAACLSEKPDGIFADHWVAFVNALERRIHGNVEYWINSDETFESVVDAGYFGSLPTNVQQIIRKRLYDHKVSRIPRVFGVESEARDFLDNFDFSWMTVDDADRFKKRAETIIRLHQDKKMYEVLLANLSRILIGGTCSSEIANYGELAESLKKVESEIVGTRKDISEEKNRLDELKKYLEEAKRKVDRQLEILGCVFRGEVERFNSLEYPEEVFGDTNIARIKEVVSRLSAAAESG